MLQCVHRYSVPKRCSDRSDANKAFVYEQAAKDKSEILSTLLIITFSAKRHSLERLQCLERPVKPTKKSQVSLFVIRLPKPIRHQLYRLSDFGTHITIR